MDHRVFARATIGVLTVCDVIIASPLKTATWWLVTSELQVTIIDGKGGTLCKCLVGGRSWLRHCWVVVVCAQPAMLRTLHDSCPLLRHCTKQGAWPCRDQELTLKLRSDVCCLDLYSGTPSCFPIRLCSVSGQVMSAKSCQP